jgi:hypothetical protein
MPGAPDVPVMRSPDLDREHQRDEQRAAVLKGREKLSLKRLVSREPIQRPGVHIDAWFFRPDDGVRRIAPFLDCDHGGGF